MRIETPDWLIEYYKNLYREGNMKPSNYNPHDVGDDLSQTAVKTLRQEVKDLAKEVKDLKDDRLNKLLLELIDLLKNRG